MELLQLSRILVIRNRKTKALKTNKAHKQKTAIEYLRRLEWIIWRKMYSYKKDTPCIGAIWGTHNGRLPVKHVFCNRAYKNDKLI